MPTVLLQVQNARTRRKVHNMTEHAERCLQQISNKTAMYTFSRAVK